jgi:tRNA wybutosine-synthesizing protein 1
MFKKQYNQVGNHSAVQICFWNKEALKKKDKVCYKEHFYDVHCAKCLEMSPALICNQSCRHCWRDTSLFSKDWKGEYDSPQEIIKGAIEERRKLLMGFKGREGTNLEELNDALIPDHAAISLTGEPTMYPLLPELVESYFKDFNFRTVFLVTNGTQPEVLKKLKVFPTNIYLSLEAYDEESYQQFNHPSSPELYDNVLESMKFLSTVKDKTRTILRITSIKGFNMDKVKNLIKYIELMQPTFIELKGYSFLGYSRLRMQQSNVPSFVEVKEFAEKIAQNTDYKITDEHEPSIIVQLGK